MGCDWSVGPAGALLGALQPAAPSLVLRVEKPRLGPPRRRVPKVLSRRPPIELPAVRESKVTVKIPRPLYRKIQQVVEDSGFNSPTDFIVYVLRDLMGEAEEHKPAAEYSPEEVEDVKRKLRNLGYL